MLTLKSRSLANYVAVDAREAWGKYTAFCIFLCHPESYHDSNDEHMDYPQRADGQAKDLRMQTCTPRIRQATTSDNLLVSLNNLVEVNLESFSAEIHPYLPTYSTPYLWFWIGTRP